MARGGFLYVDQCARSGADGGHAARRIAASAEAQRSRDGRVTLARVAFFLGSLTLYTFDDALAYFASIFKTQTQHPDAALVTLLHSLRIAMLVASACGAVGGGLLFDARGYRTAALLTVGLISAGSVWSCVAFGLATSQLPSTGPYATLLQIAGSRVFSGVGIGMTLPIAATLAFDVWERPPLQRTSSRGEPERKAARCACACMRRDAWRVGSVVAMQAIAWVVSAMLSSLVGVLIGPTGSFSPSAASPAVWKLQLHPILALAITVLVGGWVAALAARLAVLDRRLEETELWAARERGGGALLDSLADDGGGGGGGERGVERGGGGGGAARCAAACACTDARALVRRVCGDQRAFLAASLPWAAFSVGFYAAYVASFVVCEVALRVSATRALSPARHLATLALLPCTATR